MPHVNVVTLADGRPYVQALVIVKGIALAPCRFLVDTGASCTLITPALQSKLARKNPEVWKSLKFADRRSHGIKAIESLMGPGHVKCLTSHGANRLGLAFPVHARQDQTLNIFVDRMLFSDVPRKGKKEDAPGAGLRYGILGMDIIRKITLVSFNRVGRAEHDADTFMSNENGRIRSLFSGSDFSGLAGIT